MYTYQVSSIINSYGEDSEFKKRLERTRKRSLRRKILPPHRFRYSKKKCNVFKKNNVKKVIKNPPDYFPTYESSSWYTLYGLDN